MKLSLVFELLLIFVLLAFAASKNIGRQKNNRKGIQKASDGIQIEDNSINKFCKCSEALCNCCRDFAVPIINLNGPGCASLMYLNGDKMSVSLSFGNKVITNRTLTSRKPSPVCMPLPGGISKFCGRVYNIARIGEEFRACLGLELQAKSSVEAAVRVSCFKFGPRGVISEPADPLPLVPKDEKDTDDDDDDDDDDVDFGLDADDDDDDDDDDDGDDDGDDDEDDDGGIDAVNGVESVDYTGFSLLGEDLLGDLFGGASGGKKGNKNKNKNKQAPIVSTSTTRRPRPSRRPIRPTRTTTPRPNTRSTTVKVRPVNRRPTRRPVRRPTRRPTTASATKLDESSTPSTISTTIAPVSVADIKIIEPLKEIVEASHIAEVHQVIPITQPPIMPSESTSSSVTSFEDPGLEMSLAHITGQLSFMPVTQLIPTNTKDTNENVPSDEEVNYEKIQTITSKPHSTIPFATVVDDDDKDMVQIVQSLDSNSEEHAADSENVIEDNRSHKDVQPTNDYEGLSLPKKKNRGFHLGDLDVLDLTGIGESVGHQLGIFGGGRHRRQNKNKEPKPHNVRGVSDYDDLLGLDALSETLHSFPDIDDLSRKDRRRQNKMMRGLWPAA